VMGSGMAGIDDRQDSLHQGLVHIHIRARSVRI
jgi:hypothetical protein